MDLNEFPELNDPGIFEINKDTLDVDWVKQTGYCFKLGEVAAKARMVYEDAKRALDVALAEADMAVRANPGMYGVAKVTEATVQSAVQLIPSVQEARDKLTKMRYKLDIANAAVSAMEHKKKALEGLTSLRAQNYYSSKMV